MRKNTKLALKDAVVEIGRALLDAEHNHFVAEPLDNRDHVPRILRIARAVSTASRRVGLGEGDVNAIREALESHGKDLFLDEWKAQIVEGEDRRRVMEEGCEEYTRLYNAARRGVDDV